VPLASVDRIIAIGSDRMMAAVKAARRGALAAFSQTGARRHRQHQLADAMHDEGSVRAMPAEARRFRQPAVRASSFPASTRTRNWIESTSRIWPPGCDQNTVQEKLSKHCGFDHVIADARLPHI
jgi:hypothetical protein